MLLALPAISHAATVEYKLYLDSDNNPATGCTVPVAESGYSGTLSGIEQIITLTAQNNTLPISVTGITRAICAGGSFGAPVAVSPGGWSVAAGAGLNGADAIEGYVPLAGLGANGAVRLYVSANPAGQAVVDIILSQSGGSGGPPILTALSSGPLNSIPALNPGVLVLLALGLAVLSHRRLRHHFPPLAAVTLAVTLGLAGAKSAEAVLATITPDGNIADWSGIAPAAQDPAGDTGNGNAANDLAALYLANDSANLYYRVDVVGLSNHAPTANDFTYGSNIDNSAKTFDWKVLSSAADANNDPLAATVQAQGTKGTFGVAGDNVTYTPSATQTGSDSGTLRISDGQGGAKDITVTVNGIDTVAPTTSAGPSVSGTTDTATTLSATINENGTGYYLVQALADPVPSVATVQAGTSFAMTANVAATPAIGGLTASTAYKIYFVAKDTANNVQAAVQSVDVTTNAAAAAPTASAVSISGTAQVGQVLTGNYSYADVNGDAEGTSTFRWLRGGVAIAGATASTYTLVADDQGATITFEVTPVAAVAPTTGTPVVSAATAAVVAAAAAPTASAVSISGTAQVGQVLTGNHTYADVNGDAEGTTTFRWLRGGVAIAGATASSYTLVADDQGATITFEVTPVATIAPTTGTPVVSAATAAVVAAAAAPTANAVSISGTTQAGQLLTGHYTYADANGDAQGGSTFRWLRNGAPIAGATASTYTLVIADVGSTITFEVTPVANVAPTTGTAVASAATAAITLPAGYVSQGGLTWMPNNVVNPPNGYDTWTNANAYCSGTTILGQTGWRLPTTVELIDLYASGAIAGQGWALLFTFTWSSTPHGADGHEYVRLDYGFVNWNYDTGIGDVSCVR